MREPSENLATTPAIRTRPVGELRKTGRTTFVLTTSVDLMGWTLPIDVEFSFEGVSVEREVDNRHIGEPGLVEPLTGLPSFSFEGFRVLDVRPGPPR